MEPWTNSSPRSTSLVTQRLLLNLLLVLIDTLVLLRKAMGHRLIFLAQQSQKTDLPLNAVLELLVSARKRRFSAAEQLVHLFKRLAFRLRYQEEDPQRRDSCNGAKEDEGAEVRRAKEGRGGETDGCEYVSGVKPAELEVRVETYRSCSAS